MNLEDERQNRMQSYVIIYKKFHVQISAIEYQADYIEVVKKNWNTSQTYKA